MRPSMKTLPFFFAAFLLGFLAIRASATTYYVDVNSTNPTPPYLSWSTASTDIQSAVNLTTNGDLVLVNPGLYQSGGYTAPDGNLSCVVVSNTITLQSVNGPSETSIVGTNFSLINSTIYSMRCIYLGNYAVLSGFTLTNGTVYGGNGAGVYCASTNAWVTNCVLINCIASIGGGAYSGAFNNCSFYGNVANNGGDGGGGAFGSTLNNCLISSNSAVNGGGTYNCTLNSCVLSNNFAQNFSAHAAYGGGAFECALSNCFLTGNFALDSGYGGGTSGGSAQSCIFSNNWATYGGGAASTVLTNCLLVDNFATNGGGFAEGGGAYNCQLYGCWIQNNSISNAVGAVAMYGGGAEHCTLTNCALLGNTITAYIFDGQEEPSAYGGGADFSTLNNCKICGNIVTNAISGIVSYGGGVNNCILQDCIVNSNFCYDGGGANDSTLNRCYLIGNGAAVGGAVVDCTVYDSLLLGNTAGNAGGSYESTLMSCTIVSNAELTAVYQGDGPNLVGGVLESTLTNCILYFNTAQGTNYANFETNAIGTYGGYKDVLAYSCTYPMPPGPGNITNQPVFIDPSTGNYRLQTNSPCINTGKNSYVTNKVDLDGRSRIVGGTVDMGAYEFQGPGIGEFVAWLQQYDLPTDGSVDYADLDGTGFDVDQDWIAGLNPTNPASVLALLPPAQTNNASGITVTWQSVSGINYFLQRTTNLPTPFSTIQTNITGQSNTTSYLDTSATNNVPYFYRVGVP